MLLRSLLISSEGAVSRTKRCVMDRFSTESMAVAAERWLHYLKLAEIYSRLPESDQDQHVVENACLYRAKPLK